MCGVKVKLFLSLLCDIHVVTLDAMPAYLVPTWRPWSQILTPRQPRYCAKGVKEARYSEVRRLGGAVIRQVNEPET